MTSPATHERQRALNLSIPPSVSIIGCGGVGSWIAMFLALAGVPHLYLWDGDEVSETNLNRLPLGPQYLYQNKAMSMRHFLNKVVPRCDVVPMAENWTPDAQAEFTTPAWFVAATDSHASRRQIYEWCQATQHMHPVCARYIECSAEGEWGGATDSPAMFTTDLELDPGYASVPVHVGPCVMAASMVCYHVLHYSAVPVFNYRIGFNGQRITFQDL